MLNLIKKTQFDTIYHEHFSYIVYYICDYLLKKFDLRIFDIEKISTHGGSLRVYVCHQTSYKENKSVQKIREEEFEFGLSKEHIYLNFQSKVDIKSTKLLNI